MSRKLRPLAALAMVALIGAGCSNGAAETGNTGTGSKNATNRDMTVQFADQEAGPGLRGVEEGHRRV
jgi:hypothetical protein